jgi:hypothetical protein
MEQEHGYFILLFIYFLSAIKTTTGHTLALAFAWPQGWQNVYTTVLQVLQDTFTDLLFMFKTNYAMRERVELCFVV